MKFSIITVCFNSSATIECTLKSVANQKNVNVEHLLIDGGSTDGTLNIINQYKTVTNLLSEPDKGIYDAMNKGISLATGDVVGILNADDFYMNEHVLQDVEKVFLNPTVEACYGDLLYVRKDNIHQTVRFWKSRDYRVGLFRYGWMPAHPTFFVRKNVYDKLGAFDLNYTIAADFELLFRFIEQNKIKTQYLPKVLVIMRLGGTTNNSLLNVIKQNKQIKTIVKNYYGSFSITKFFIYKLINRILQFFHRPKSDYR